MPLRVSISPVVVASLTLAALLASTETRPFAAGKSLPAPVTIGSGWLMQDIAQVTAGGEVISTPGFVPVVYTPMPYVSPATASANPPDNPGTNGTDRPKSSSAWSQAPAPSSKAWYRATVPGTVLTTLVNNGVYPEPLYGENNRPNVIPESLARTSYWYRAEFTVPADYKDKRVWLRFDGINYLADVWVNGTKTGAIRGAFARGTFDVTPLVKAGKKAVVAVLITPPLTPSDPVEQTQQWGLGYNGGIMSHDGPTFVSAQGWDWIPAIRDREAGIWQRVTLAASGPVTLRDPHVVTSVTLPTGMPGMPVMSGVANATVASSADVLIDATVQNVSETAQTGVIIGSLGEIRFASSSVTLAAGETQTISLRPETTPALHVINPRLWWPNGFGDPNLYPLHLSFDIHGDASDAADLNVGIRSVSYTYGDSGNLALVVNGVPVFAKGGDWGMDEALKRIPRGRLDAQMRLHKEANYTIVRNWVGQSTSEDFYDLADRYGLMVWDEFFQPAAGLDSGRQRGEDGEADVTDVSLYLANAREKLLRFRNHPSIVIWCGRNEGDPSPKALALGLQQLIADLDPVRYYHANSDAGRGVRSGGPYSWQPPQNYYGEGRGGRGALVPFKTEIGPISIPTIEAIYSMMPAADAEKFPNDDWAEHDFAIGGGNNLAGSYLATLKSRYGPVDTLPEFIRAAQMADYEAERAMYEGRFAKLFDPSNAVITWMSNPSQPSTTWQIYSYDLEPFASFFGVRKACEPLHIQMNQTDAHVMVINHRPSVVEGLTFRVRVVTPDGVVALDRADAAGAVRASAATDLGAIEFPATLPPVHFVKVELFDAQHQLVSDNFYWRNSVAPNDLTAMDAMPMVTLDLSVARHDERGRVKLDVTVSNPTTQVAVMAHLQLRRQKTDARVLPVTYSDNYVSLLPGESRVIQIDAALADLGGDKPLVTIDGWNVTTTAKVFPKNGGASVAPNVRAIVTR